MPWKTWAHQPFLSLWPATSCSHLCLCRLTCSPHLLYHRRPQHPLLPPQWGGHFNNFLLHLPHCPFYPGTGSVQALPEAEPLQGCRAWQLSHPPPWDTLPRNRHPTASGLPGNLHQDPSRGFQPRFQYSPPRSGGGQASPAQRAKLSLQADHWLLVGPESACAAREDCLGHQVH